MRLYNEENLFLVFVTQLLLTEADSICDGGYHCGVLNFNQFRPPIALRTDLSHITTELWKIPVLRMAH